MDRLLEHPSPRPARHVDPVALDPALPPRHPSGPIPLDGPHVLRLARSGPRHQPLLDADPAGPLAGPDEPSLDQAARGRPLADDPPEAVALDDLGAASDVRDPRRRAGRRVERELGPPLRGHDCGHEPVGVVALVALEALAWPQPRRQQPVVVPLPPGPLDPAAIAPDRLPQGLLPVSVPRLASVAVAGLDGAIVVVVVRLGRLAGVGPLARLDSHAVALVRQSTLRLRGASPKRQIPGQAEPHVEPDGVLPCALVRPDSRAHAPVVVLLAPRRGLDDRPVGRLPAGLVHGGEPAPPDGVVPPPFARALVHAEELPGGVGREPHRRLGPAVPHGHAADLARGRRGVAGPRLTLRPAPGPVERHHPTVGVIDADHLGLREHVCVGRGEQPLVREGLGDGLGDAPRAPLPAVRRTLGGELLEVQQPLGLVVGRRSRGRVVRILPPGHRGPVTLGVDDHAQRPGRRSPHAVLIPPARPVPAGVGQRCARRGPRQQRAGVVELHPRHGVAGLVERRRVPGAVGIIAFVRSVGPDPWRLADERAARRVHQLCGHEAVHLQIIEPMGVALEGPLLVFEADGVPTHPGAGDRLHLLELEGGRVVHVVEAVAGQIANRAQEQLPGLGAAVRPPPRRAVPRKREVVGRAVGGGVQVPGRGRDAGSLPVVGLHRGLADQGPAQPPPLSGEHRHVAAKPATQPGDALAVAPQERHCAPAVALDHAGVVGV